MPYYQIRHRNHTLKKKYKVIGKFYSIKSSSELNSVIHGKAPNRYTEIEGKYGKGTYAVKYNYK